MATFNLTTTSDPFVQDPWVSNELVNVAGAHILNVAQDTFLVAESPAYDYFGYEYDFGIWITPNLFDPNSGPYGPDNNQSWTININGGVLALSVGIQLNNYKSAVNNIINVGSEGAVAGSFAGINSTVASTITNNGLISGIFTGINFTTEFYNYFNSYTFVSNGTTYWYYDEPELATNLNIAGKVNTITNNVNGVIESYTTAIRNNSLASLTVTNSGLITGGSELNEYNYNYYDYIAGIDSGLGRLTLTNNLEGQINGDIISKYVGNVITNSGEINGTISTDQYIDLVNDQFIFDIDRDFDFTDTTGGAVQVNIYAALVNTIVNNVGAVISGSYTYYYNEYNYYLYEYQTALNLSYISDRLTNNGEIDGDIFLRSGSLDTVINTGAIYGSVDLGTGVNTLTNTKSASAVGLISGDVIAYGKTTLTNSGDIIGNVSLNWIGNTLTNNVNSAIGGSILGALSESIDYYFSNYLNETSVIDTDQDGLFTDAGGFSTLNLIDRNITVAVNTITNNGLIKAFQQQYAINLGIGRDVVTNSVTGRLDGGVSLGSGADTLTNLGVIGGNVDMGWGFGINSITNTGSRTGGLIVGDVISGSQLTMSTQSGVIAGNVYLGWIGNTINNTNQILGGILSSFFSYDVSYDYNQEFIDYNANASTFGTAIKFDLNKDGSFADLNNTLYAIGTSLTFAVNTITNSGIISGIKDYVVGNYYIDDYEYPITSHVAMDLSEGRDVVSNTITGRITGDLLFKEGSDLLTNLGMIYGSVDMGGGYGDNTIVNTGSSTGGGIGGNIYSFGKLTMTTQSGVIGGSLYLGWIGNTVTNSNIIAGAIFSGVDLSDASDNYDYIDYNNGNYIFDTNKDGSFEDANGFITYQNFLTTVDVNTITNSGTIYGLLNYEYDIYVEEIIDLAMDLSEGRDVVTNSGRINGQIRFNEGNDSLNNLATGTILGEVYLGDGADVLVNAGLIYGAVIDEGSGNVNSNVITNTGSIVGGIFLADGDDTLTTTKLIAGDVSLGGGNDTITIGSGGRVLFDISLGDGDDKFNFGSSLAVTTQAVKDYVSDGLGADIVNLAAGNDIMFVTPDEDIDSYAGGVGNDVLDLSYLDEGAIVNLSSVTVDGIGAGKMLILGVSDTISGFEIIKGSLYNDKFIAGSAKETFTGSDGEDTFYFGSISNSGRTRATRDTITDFSEGEDKIDLSNLYSGDLNFIGTNQKFTGLAGSLRSYFSGAQTIIEADIDGNNVAEFGVALNSLIFLESADFYL